MADGAIVGVFLSFAVLLFIASFVFWVMMIVDAAKRKFPGSSAKVGWILVLVFLGILGAIIYYFAVKLQDKEVKPKRKR